MLPLGATDILCLELEMYGVPDACRTIHDAEKLLSEKEGPGVQSRDNDMNTWGSMWTPRCLLRRQSCSFGPSTVPRFTKGLP